MQRHTSCNMKYGSLKRGMRESILLTREFIPWFGLHKGAPTSTLLKYSQRVSLSGNQVSFVNTITVTLIPLSTKELHQEGWGFPRPPHKNVDAAPHQAGGSLTLPASHQDSKDGRRIKITLEPRTRQQHLALSLKN